jgi:DNA helicase-2/ATP-dependent DNA helicase PcrA
MSRDYVLRSFRPAVDLQIDYAKELNADQYAAVTAAPGPALVIAGAGAGKTRTLTYRVAYLLEQGIPPEHILLLTFTNKAAREMMDRVTSLLGRQYPAMWGGTFHSVGNRVLRRHANLLGYSPDFSILDREDAKGILTACLDQVVGKDSGQLMPKAEVLCELFSLAANTCQPLPVLLERKFKEWEAVRLLIEKTAETYAERKRAAGLMDFDDLLSLWLRLLEKESAVREHYQHRFQFILVDEYQDTNRLQSSIIDLLAAHHRNLMVVGDDSQSIYSWRGASFRNILEFPKRYPGSLTYKIETNYRSIPEILELANAVIANNVHQHPKNLVAVRPPGAKPGLVQCRTAEEQASFVAQRIEECREEEVPLDEIAVLYRSHFHAFELQMELTRCSIPFSMTSGIRFFEQAHIKDVASYVRLVLNPADELAYKRLVRMLPGVGEKAAEKLYRLSVGYLKALSTEERSAHLLEALDAARGAVPKKALPLWTQLRDTVEQLGAADVRTDVPTMIRLVLEAGYEEYLELSYDNSHARLEDLEQLASFAEKFADPQEFLTQLALMTNMEAESSDKEKQEEPRVRLSTIHQAKGLEFRVVFLIMLCEGMFPSGRAVEESEGEEEERRLFYVGITRAKDLLYLCHPQMRFARGYSGDAFKEPSRFLAEFPRKLVEDWNLVGGGGY